MPGPSCTSRAARRRPSPRPACSPAGRLVRQACRHPHVVRVEKCDVGRGGMRRAEIARGAHPSVLVSGMVDVADPLVLGRQIASNQRASVGGPVVNEDQFPVRQCLVANALHRFFKKALLIEEDQHDGDERHGSSVAMRRPGKQAHQTRRPAGVRARAPAGPSTRSPDAPPVCAP